MLKWHASENAVTLVPFKQLRETMMGVKRIFGELNSPPWC